MSAHSYPSAPLSPPPAAPRPRGRTLHLAAAIGGGPPARGASYRDLARLAEGGGLDFVTLELHPYGGAGLLDALELLAAVAPATDRIGVVPAVPAAGAEPGDVAAAVATLDWVSRGRAGWTLAVPAPPPGPPGRGRRPDLPEAVWRAAGDTASAVTRIWRGAGLGPPLSAPVTVLDATEPAARAVAARHADIAFVRAARPEGAGLIRADIHRLAAEAGRDPDRLLVLAELAVDLGGGEVGPEPGAEIALTPDASGGVLFRGGPVDLAELIADWQRQGAVDGFHVRPVELPRDLERFVNGTAALLQHRGLFRSFHPGATLREHLGLHRPARPSAVRGGVLS
ncbi:LLM class flavin-dependent oxidoreductase [Streptomyces sp. NBC_01477]|uniref:LLM class flavin-dependent oxidoreductase n=1 Tax=Streptomyces sp. NBC_01477 TaxID=2976015 RepID=UPI002E3580C7|nr:LLM class flavin-dependent oxidoreductase [Streptomyces sp. NBC_01477]